ARAVSASHSPIWRCLSDGLSLARRCAEQGVQPLPAGRARREAGAADQPRRGRTRRDQAQEAHEPRARGDRGGQGRVPGQGRRRDREGMSLAGRELILGVTGSIAAYKAVYLLRELTRLGASVTVCLSEHAREFVGALTFRTLSGRPVLTNLFDPQSEDAVEHVALAERALAGERLLVTAGPTREPIDPVRYISNRSSGKMGYGLAGAALRRGAAVTLVSGPTALTPPPGAVFVPVQTAEEMREAVLQHLADATLVIKAAAVADYRARQAAPVKLKGKRDLTLDLTPNPD